MSVLTPPTSPLLPPSLPVYRFTVDEYHRLIQTGFLTEDSNVELLEGLLVPKMSRNPPRDIALELADEAIRPRLPAGWRIRNQSAVTTTDSEPEPDLSVVRGDARSRRGRHPRASEVGLLVEVSDTTLTRDREDKGRLYARAEIGCYWIVNLIDRHIEVYSDPTGPTEAPTYRQRQVYRVGDVVPLVLDGQLVAEIPVADLLP